MDEPTAGHPAPPAVGSGALVRTILASGAIAALWSALAWHSPATTYHLAPLLVVLGPGWVSVRRPSTTQAAATLVAISAATATATAVALAALDVLDGPTLTGDGSALGEALVFIAGGLAWSLVRARHRARRPNA